MSDYHRYSDDKDENETLREIQARLRAASLAGHGPSHTHAFQSTEPLIRQPLLNQEPEQYHDEKDHQRYRDGDGEEYGENYERPSGCYDVYHEQGSMSRARSFVRSRCGPKYFAGLLIFAFAIFSCVYWILYPELVDREMRPGFINPIKDGEEKLNTMGVAKGGEYQHSAVKIQDLDEQFNLEASRIHTANGVSSSLETFMVAKRSS
jgi:hypothetical protein